MKKLICAGFVLLLAVISGCSGSYQGGELTGVDNRSKFYEPDPYGMVFIPQGSYNMGPNDQDAAWAQSSLTKTVTTGAFWMDETEITNNEYRQFVFWVRDSIMRRMLGEQLDDFLITEDEYGNLIDPPAINWETRIDMRDEEINEILSDLYLNQQERFFYKKEIDTRKLNYEYWWIDLKQAASKSNRYNYETGEYEGYIVNSQGEQVEIMDRSSFVIRDMVNVYPDTLVWIADFTYSFNEPYTTSYFWHPSYDNYPVVGVTWKQANAFCIWRSMYLNASLRSTGHPGVPDYRLPIESEWEYAARGGLDNSMYPWGGYYSRNMDGCFLANFKPMRGRYVDDGGITTVAVGSYQPNEYGLYDMAGNVAEWTSSAYDESAYLFTNDLNPDYRYNAKPDDLPVMKRKVIRGGSWKDIAYFLQNGSRTYEYQDTAKSYIGFRCVRSYMGSN
ncbi:MAG: SUMF1/EgtB/PvdO family nonheme iron enzyme [Bacteroidales bacterium]|nr:SUMF1/EgtB/PvdO family nonheme iron enzyme [Bacteroidales bacterium]